MRTARIEPGWWARLVAAINPHSLDNRLLAGDSPATSPELAARYERLSAPRHLRGLADKLERVVEEASAPARFSRRSPRVPLRRGEIRKHRSLLLALSRDLRGPSPPELRGVILADRLLSDGRSPLYAGELIFDEQERPSIEIAVRQARTALQLR